MDGVSGKNGAPKSRFVDRHEVNEGRRLNVEGSEVSIVPYAQPTLIIWNHPGFVERDTEVEFSFGLGGDFRLSRAFDVRVSVGIGDVFEGISVAMVWVR